MLGARCCVYSYRGIRQPKPARFVSCHGQRTEAAKIFHLRPFFAATVTGLHLCQRGRPPSIHSAHHLEEAWQRHHGKVRQDTMIKTYHGREG